MVLQIDGVNYSEVTVNIRRSFEVVDGEQAGRTLDGVMHRDLIGTYYNYNVTVNTSRLSQNMYNALYEVISSPQESHYIVVAYGDEELEYNAYVTRGSDTLYREDDPAHRYWGDLSFDMIAMEPQRRAL